jgi:glycosyltransferase involved in cell wall biosynthesis
MKIIHAVTSLLNGGLENMMVDIANIQSKLGNDVAIIIINKNIDKSILKRIHSNIPVYLIGRKRGSKSLLPLIKLFLVFRKLRKFKLIHSHGLNLIKLLKWFSRKKIVLTIHDVNLDCRNFKGYDGLFAISNAVKDDVQRRSDYKPKLVYNGINSKIITSKIDYTKPETIKIIQISGLNSQKKGQDILIRAIHDLIPKFSPYELQVHFVGSGSSLDKLKELTAELELKNYINFLGNKDRDWVYSNLKNYDIFIQPSRHEGFGLTVTEAMAAKIPVIVSNIDGPVEIICNGTYGFLFESENVCQLRQKIEEVILMISEGDHVKLINKAYDHCLENFEVSKTAENYVMEYKKILQS